MSDETFDELMTTTQVLGFDVTVTKDEDRFDASVFGATSKTYLIGRTMWHAWIKWDGHSCHVTALDGDTLIKSINQEMLHMLNRGKP